MTEDRQSWGRLNIQRQGIPKYGCGDGKTNDGSQSIYEIMERAVDVLTTSEDGENTKLIPIWWSETVQHTKGHNSYLKVDPFWQVQPMQSSVNMTDETIEKQTVLSTDV